MSIKDLTDKVRKLKELETFLAEIEAEAETIKDEIKAEMNAQGVEEMAVDVFKVRYKTITSSRLDSKALKSEQVDLYNRYCKSTTSRRFSIA